MINAEQIRGARALLDWPTSVLAEKTGLTVNGINKIERGHVSAQKDTIEKIQTVFEQGGVEFLPGSGVRRKSEMVFVFEGPDANKMLALDITRHLTPQGGQVLIMYPDEMAALVNLDDAYMEKQYKERNAVGITYRLLVSKQRENSDILWQGAYRIMPSDYLSNCPLFIYGNRLALLSPDAVPKIIIVEHDRIAESVRRLFNFVWDHAQPIGQPKTKEGAL